LQFLLLLPHPYQVADDSYQYYDDDGQYHGEPDYFLISILRGIQGPVCGISQDFNGYRGRFGLGDDGGSGGCQGVIGFGRGEGEGVLEDLLVVVCYVAVRDWSFAI